MYFLCTLNCPQCKNPQCKNLDLLKILPLYGTNLHDILPCLLLVMSIQNIHFPKGMHCCLVTLFMAFFKWRNVHLHKLKCTK